MVSKAKLERIKKDLLQQLPEGNNEDYKQELINKLDRIAERRVKPYFDDMVTQLEEGLQEETDPVKIEVWKSMLKVVRESDREAYNRQVKEHNQKVRGA